MGYSPWGSKELDTTEQLSLIAGQKQPQSIHRLISLLAMFQYVLLYLKKQVMGWICPWAIAVGSWTRLRPWIETWKGEEPKATPS